MSSKPPYREPVFEIRGSSCPRARLSCDFPSPRVGPHLYGRHNREGLVKGCLDLAPTRRQEILTFSRISPFQGARCSYVASNRACRRVAPVSPPASGDEGIAATKTKARGSARRGGRHFHRDEHWAARLSPEGGDPSQPRPAAWVEKLNPFQRVSPEGAKEWLALSGLAAVIAH
jgi:hypothetical protein